MKHPIQPLEKDARGVLRFKPNKIIKRLLDEGVIDLNKVAATSPDKEDHQQLAQLIGYSLDGYGSLSYVTDEAFGAATRVAEDPEINHLTARVEHLERVLQELRDGLKGPLASLYGCHEDSFLDIGRNTP